MALAMIEKILFLKTVPLFDQIPSEELIGVAQIVQEVQFDAGEAFIKQGESGDCLYVIIDGEVDVVIEGVGRVDHFGSKSIIGETAILSDNPRNASCIATTDVTALKIEQDDFWELMGEKPEIALGIIKVLVYQLNELIKRLQSSQSDSWQASGRVQDEQPT
jgi:CRP-like cAMP-binding protein